MIRDFEEVMNYCSVQGLIDQSEAPAVIHVTEDGIQVAYVILAMVFLKEVMMVSEMESEFAAQLAEQKGLDPDEVRVDIEHIGATFLWGAMKSLGLHPQYRDALVHVMQTATEKFRRMGGEDE